jgi:hypothetical protein
MEGVKGCQSTLTKTMNVGSDDSKVQYSTVQYNTIQYSTVQYSTVQYSTVQHSTVRYSEKKNDFLL